MKAAFPYTVAFALALNLIGSVQAADLPETSIYHLDVTLTDQQGIEQSLDTFRGHPVIVSMFYATCPYVCPLLISTIQLIERQLPTNELSQLRVLLVSVDPANDTPQVLNQVAAKHHIDTDRWKLARATPQDVRKIAAVLSVRYRKLPNDEFNHTSILTLVDGNGVVQERSTKIPGIDESFLRAIKERMRP
jgi:protein SCO1/2